MSFKILTIDDSTVIRKILKQTFSGYDCGVYEGANGQEGLRVALKVKPDLIILDIDMPVMNGWDTLASIRFDEDLNKIPVIMLTANTHEKNEERARALRVAEFVKKPFKPEEIIKAVSRFVELPSK